MGNCLVTKLKESVSNNNLPILGKVMFVNDTDTVRAFTINQGSEDIALTVVGGHFTDSTGSADYGTTAINAAGDYIANTRYVTAGSRVYADKYVPAVYDLNYFKVDISELCATPFTYLGGIFIGNVSFLDADSVEYFMSTWDWYNEENRSSYNGDLTQLFSNNQSTLKEVVPRSSGNVTFNLENLNFTQGLKLYGIRDTVAGMDISKISGIYEFSRDSALVVFDSWSLSSTSNPYITALNNIKFMTATEIDNMLISQASKEAHPSAVDFNITIFGGPDSDITRTSASDAAVATLKSKGFTIRINNITQ